MQRCKCNLEVQSKILRLISSKNSAYQDDLVTPSKEITPKAAFKKPLYAK
jgi:hypothetical protein